MKQYVINTSEQIDTHSLCVFYTYAVLPQFGISDTAVIWFDSKEIIPYDEVVFWFTVGDTKYALIFEDYDGNGRNDNYLREEVLTEGQTYEFVAPISESTAHPSYVGFHLPVPSQYSEYITGTYTLIRIQDEDSKQTTE